MKNDYEMKNERIVFLFTCGDDDTEIVSTWYNDDIESVAVWLTVDQTLGRHSQTSEIIHDNPSDNYCRR